MTFLDNNNDDNDHDHDDDADNNNNIIIKKNNNNTTTHSIFRQGLYVYLYWSYVGHGLTCICFRSGGHLH